jgi:hypothetical protein
VRTPRGIGNKTKQEEGVKQKALIKRIEKIESGVMKEYKHLEATFHAETQTRNAAGICL